MIYKNCFLIYSPKQNISGILEVMRNKCINIIHPILDFDLDIMDSIENSIKKSDFICCLLNKSTNKDQIYELGFAKGLNKPIFMIVEDDMMIPFSIKNFVYVKTNAENIEAISYNLEQFLNNTNRRKYVGDSKKLKRNKKKNISNEEFLIEQLYEANITEEKIANIIINLLSYHQNITVVSQDRSMDKGADLAIWIDEIEMSLGGPILIELKTHANVSNDFFVLYKNQMTNYLLATNSPVGIVIFRSDRDDIPITDNHDLPLIIFMELRTFVRYITEGKLAKILIERRNEAVHRGGYNG